MKTYTEIIAEAANNANLADLIKRRDNMSVKLSDWRKKGKDTSALEQELAQIRADIAAIRAASKNGGVASAQPAAPRTTGTANNATISDIDDYIKKATAHMSPQAKKDWEEGYRAALDAIKDVQNGKGQGGQGGQQGQIDPNALPMPGQGQQGQQQGQSGSGQQGQQGQQGGQQGQGGSGSQQGGQQGGSNSRGSGNQGVVRPEDCMDPTGSLSGIPDTAGGMVSKSDGDAIAQAEGHEKQGGNESAVEKDWSQQAGKVASKMAGSSAGNAEKKFAEKILGIYKPKKNWKKELRKVVGTAISPLDKRRGYTSNNILVSQDRIALTDKQRYNTMDYMIVCLDTSGSFMGDQDYLYQSLSEVASIAMAKKPLKVYVIQWDTRITAIDEYTQYSKLIDDVKKGKFTMKGGGGTDPSCVWELLKTDKRFKFIRPELTIIFTDGYLGTTPKRDARRMNHLVWCVIDNVSFKAPKDTFTKTVHISLKS